MKVNRLETHDRHQHLIQDQSETVEQGATDCLKTNKLSLAYQERSPYVYIFGHARTLGFDEKMALWSSGQFQNFEEIPEKILMWQPRLSKPEPQENSFLFRATSKTDIVEVCWILPPKEMWNQYKKGNVAESSYSEWSIDQYKNNKEQLGAPFPDDLPDDVALDILNKIKTDWRQEKLRDKYFNQGSLAPFSAL